MYGEYYKTKRRSNGSYADMLNIDPEAYKKVLIDEDLMGLSKRTCNCLKKNGILSVCDLLQMSDTSLAKIHGLGRNGLMEVNNYLKKLKRDPGKRKMCLKIERHCFSHELMFYRNEIYEGEFTHIDKSRLNEEDCEFVEKFKIAYGDTDKFLIYECRDNPNKAMALQQMLIGAVEEMEEDSNKRHEILEALKCIPEERKNSYAINYIFAFSKDNSDLALIKGFYENEKSLLKDISINSIINSDDYECAILFLKWCSFDIEAEIRTFFEKCYEQENQRVILVERASGHTLEATGIKLGISRERVRQLEEKIKKSFNSWNSRYKILTQISALRNGDKILTPALLQEYFGNYNMELTYLLRTTKGTDDLYIYNSMLDVFVVGNSNIIKKIWEFIDDMPDIFNKEEFAFYLDKAKNAGLSLELFKRAITKEYKITGNMYHKSRLSMGEIYDTILVKYYPEGIWIYDDQAIDGFEDHILKDYGDVGLSSGNRAVASRIAKVGILCDKGTYKSKKDAKISSKLLNKICQYIDNSENEIFLINTLFIVFQKDMVNEGINNKYYLQGLLHEKLNGKYLFRRDYISKNSKTSIYREIKAYIKRFDYPVSKKQIMGAFPGLSDITFSFAVSDPNILNMFGKYIHASRLKFQETDSRYFKETIEKIIGDSGYCKAKSVFDYINMDDPIRLKRLYIFYQYSLFSVLKYLFGNDYQFIRPYIAKLGVTFENPSERLNELIRSSEKITLSEISEFAKEINYNIDNFLDFINEHNDTHLLINNNELMAIDQIGINKECFTQLEQGIINEIKGTTPISQLKSVYKLPQIAVPWTEWLIYSMLNKWSSLLDVGAVSLSSARQFRHSIPVVAIKGQLKEIDTSTINPSDTIALVDNLDDIDSLIEDIIVEEIGDL